MSEQSQDPMVLPKNGIATLDAFGLIQVSGEDAETFLQGQFSNDIRALKNPGDLQFSTYSNAKGRMLASLIVIRNENGFYLLMKKDILKAIAKRLRMFVLRSKVVLTELENKQMCATLLPFGQLSGVDLTLNEGLLSENLALGQLWIAPQAESLLLLDKWVKAGGVRWSESELNLHLINVGFVWVDQALQEAFVPQMANMEILGAISFKKGCFPGQEIVARMQYLGQTKRRLYKAKASVEGMSVCSGQLIFDQVGESVGIVASNGVLVNDEIVFLLVMLIKSWESSVYLTKDQKCSITYLNDYELSGN